MKPCVGVCVCVLRCRRTQLCARCPRVPINRLIVFQNVSAKSEITVLSLALALTLSVLGKPQCK